MLSAITSGVIQHSNTIQILLNIILSDIPDKIFNKTLITFFISVFSRPYQCKI